MPSNDIHAKEQTMAPILKPLVTNDDIPAQEKEMVHQAFNYIQQHRPQLDRENGATTNPVLKEHENHNKGHVVDPEHDKRLSENKNKDDDARDEQEEADERQRAEDSKRNQKKLMELKQLQDRAHTPPGLSRAAAIPGVSPLSSARPGTGVATMDPSNELKGPGNFGMPPGAKVPKPVAAPPKMKPPVAQRPAASPNGTTPFSPEETALRNHPVHGPVVNKLLGTKPGTPEMLQHVRENLNNRQQWASSVEERNDIHQALSYVAVLLIKAGALSDNNG